MLDKEREYYGAHLTEWQQSHPGKFVVVKDDQVLGFFDTLDEALSAGGARFGLSSFLVRRVGEQQETVDIPALTLGLLR
jgi:hypothetical protein